jgi:hypothetical protein
MPRDEKVLRTLAHLLAAHSRATPKQAKEPSVNHRQEIQSTNFNDD